MLSRFLNWLTPYHDEHKYIKEHRDKLVGESKRLSNRVMTQAFDLIGETESEYKRVNREMIPINQLLESMDRRRHD